MRIDERTFVCTALSSPGRAELREAAMLSVLSVDLFITLLFDYNLLTQQQELKIVIT